MADIQMPQLGESVTEGTITKWFKQVGEHIAEDEVLFEVSTDKVDSEVPSPVSGYLAEIKVPEGDTVDVGTVLAVVSDAPSGDGDDRVTGRRAPPRGRTRADRRRAGAEPQPAPAPAAPPPAAAAPAPRLRRRRRAPAPAAAREPGRLMSPVVRRLVEDYGIDLDRITPTGSGGRITRADVEKAIQQTGARSGEPAARVAPRRPPRRRARAEQRPRGDAEASIRHGRHRRAVEQHPAPHGRAHGDVQSDVAARLHDRRGRLRGRRPGASRPSRRSGAKPRASASPIFRSSLGR